MMKFLSVILISFLGFSTAWAQDAEANRIIYENGTGRATGHCSQPFTSCINRVKVDAEYNAVRDAAMRCQSQGGSFSGGHTCSSTLCSPTMIPPNAPPTYVTCSASCSIRCAVD